MLRLSLRSIRTLVPIVAVMSCGRPSAGAPLFRLLSQAHIGVMFAKTIATNDSLNAQTDPYGYNGGGGAIVDINK